MTRKSTIHKTPVKWQGIAQKIECNARREYNKGNFPSFNHFIRVSQEIEKALKRA